MIFNECKGVRIAGIAASVPEGIVDIASMANDPEEDSKFITSFIKKTGIAA